MKKYLLTMALMVFSLLIMAQEEEKASYSMVEHVIISVKPGTQNDFEKAVIAHNNAHHSGAHKAGLMRVATGKNAGTYIWDMGPCTFTDLDSRPSDEAHDDDWADNVATHIAKVHGVEYWRKVDDLSYTNDDEEYDKLSIWFLDIEDGEWYRFTNFMEKVKPIFEKLNETNTVWYKQFNDNDGRDAAIVWRMNGWAEMDNNDWNMKDEYNEMYGEGAWDDALEEWKDFVKMRTGEVWEILH